MQSNMGAFRTRWIAIAILGMTCAAACASVPHYSVVRLDAYAGASAGNAFAINDAGIAVGTSSLPDNDLTYGNAPKRTATRWDAAGAAMPLYTTPTGWRETIPVAVNFAGKAVGGLQGGFGLNGAMTIGSAWQWIPGKGELSSVNAAGRAVGTSNGEAIYSDNAAASVLPDAPYSLNSAALAISDNGIIVGYSQNGTDRYASKDPVQFTIGGAPRVLASNVGRCEPRDVNNSGLIVGFCDSLWNAYYDSGSRAAIFENGGVTRLELPSMGTNVQSYCNAVNDAGIIVGDAMRSETDDRAVAWFDRHVVDLQTQIDPALGLDLSTALAINNRGQILVQALYDGDNNPATRPTLASFRLDPIRTPGDTNYDNAVDFTDLLTLARNYGKSGDGNVFYETGDFNYDWSVDFADLLTLARNYGHPAAFAADWSLAQALAPEPAALGVVAMTSLLLGRRCRRAAAAPDRSAI